MRPGVSYLPIILKCPYCRKWFKVRTDLNRCVDDINRHIAQSDDDFHRGKDKIRIEFVTPSLLAYIRIAPAKKQAKPRQAGVVFPQL